MNYQSTGFAAQRFQVAIDIRTTAPMHIGAIEKGKYDSSTGRLYRNDGVQVGVGATLTRTQYVGDALLPVIPASTIAGKLRRAAAGLIYDSFLQRNLQVSPRLFNTLNTGTATTGLDGDSKTPELLRAARKDPFISLFGGTIFALESSIVVSTGWPLVQATVSTLMSDAIIELSSARGLGDLTEVMAIVRKNDLTDGRDTRVDRLIGIEELAAYSAAEAGQRETSRAKKDSGEVGGKTDLRTLNAIEVIRAGVPVGLRLGVQSFSPAQLGLFLLAVQALLREGQIGGRKAKGQGFFVAEASRLLSVGDDSRKTLTMASLFGSAQDGYPFLEHAVIDEAVDAGNDYLMTVVPGDLDPFAVDVQKLAAQEKPAKKATAKGGEVATK
jgi:CRISPR type IV-associated protein Csf2